MLKDDREKGKNVNEQARLVMLKLLRELDRICKDMIFLIGLMEELC